MNSPRFARPTHCFRKLTAVALASLVVGGTAGSLTEEDAIPFAAFAQFERIPYANPLLVVDPPNWAAAAHVVVVDDTVHYYWSQRDGRNFWDLRHSTAPVSDLTQLTHDPRNPILTPPATGMDSKSVEYPNPFYNPRDDRY